jgi:hypothetical protein
MPRRRAYVVEQHALLTTRVDTTTRNDSVGSHTELAFTLLSGGTRLSGSVTSFRVQAPGRVSAMPQGLVLPFAFAGELPAATHQVAFTAPTAPAPCSSAAINILQSLRDLWFRPPDTLRLHGTWEDTAAYAVCRDGIVLWVRVQRTFRVASATVRDGRVLLLVQRSSRGTLEGVGQQAGELVEIKGTSTGQVAYDLDPAAGEMVAALGTSALALTLKSRLRMQTVLQTNEMKIRLRSVDKP